MKQIELLTVFIRISVIALGIYLLRAVAGLFLYLDNNEPNAFYLMCSLYFIFFIVLVFLWFFPGTVSSKLLRNPEENLKSEHWSADQVLEVGCILLGIILFYWALTDAVDLLTFMYFLQNNSQGVSTIPYEYKAAIVTTGVEFILSLWLLVGSKGVIKTISKFRYGNR